MGRRRYFFYLTVSTRCLESANGFKLSRKTNKQTNKQTKQNKKTKNLSQGQVSLHNWGALWAKRGERSILKKRETKGGEK